MPYLYHYTDDEGAQNIVRSGRIHASVGLMAATDDAGFGNGVYLTKASPQTHTKAEVAMNNWVKTTAPFINKTKNYFVLKIPDSDVRDATETDEDRSIFIFGGRNDLCLHKYPWWLKVFDSGKILASYKYQLQSFGPAALLPIMIPKMGEYKMSEETVNGRPVYIHDNSGQYLFMSSQGRWCVGPDTGKDCGWFSQVNTSVKCSLGPDANVPWEYYFKVQWRKDHTTLRTFAWQM